MEQTDTPWAVGEAALAHQLGGSVEQAYARSDLFDRPPDAHAAVGGLPRGLVAPSRLCVSQAAFEPSSLVATGLDSIQAAMSLSFHLTAAEPTFTGRGNSSSCISRYIEARLMPVIRLNLSTPQQSVMHSIHPFVFSIVTCGLLQLGASGSDPCCRPGPGGRAGGGHWAGRSASAIATD